MITVAFDTIPVARNTSQNIIGSFIKFWGKNTLQRSGNVVNRENA